MSWTCGEAWKQGCAKPNMRDPCEWRIFKEISPPKGCMISIRRLRETAVKI
jgi:hypothetical protein